MRRLKTRVHVAGTWYGPGDEVPPKVAERIGAHAWEDDGAKPEPSSGGPQPPRSGRGSGVEAWRKFAEANGVDTDDEMNRDDVIAACEKFGVIEPERREE